MKVRVTSVTAGGVGELINNVTTAFEDRLRPALSAKDYGGGIEQFSIFYISVDSDPAENAPYCQMHNKTGKYKDFLTGKMIRYVGIAIPIDPKLVLSSSREILYGLLKSLLIKHLEQPPYKLPKEFEHQRLLADLRLVLDGHK